MWLEHARKDLLFAARQLRRAPAFTMAAVLTLALAIGANASIFTIVHRVVLSRLPYPESNQVIDLDHAGLGVSVTTGIQMSPAASAIARGTSCWADKSRSRWCS
jgi:hypothetical protein